MEKTLYDFSFITPNRQLAEDHAAEMRNKGLHARIGRRRVRFMGTSVEVHVVVTSPR